VYVPWSSSCSSSSSSSSALLLHDQVTTSDQHHHQQQQQQQQQPSDLQSELELLSLSFQSSLLNETGDGVMTLDGLPLPSAGSVSSVGDVAARLVALLEGLHTKAADSARCSTAAAATAAEMSDKHPSGIFSGVAGFSVSINSHSKSRSSSSSMQVSDQPGNAAAAIVADRLFCKQLCYQMAWHDVALGLPESASDASAVVVGGTPIKQQQQQQRCDVASVQACVSSFCPSVVATVSNQELQLLLLALDCQEQAARLQEESSNNSSSSDVQRNSCMGLCKLGATSTSVGLCQLSDACASTAPAAAPAAAGLMLLLDWGPADW
jgi:hypothetical protein